jgi:hypothetical protein
MSAPQPARDSRPSPAERSRAETGRQPHVVAGSAPANGRLPLHQPGTLSAGEVLQLQRSVGNRATAGLLAGQVPMVQRAVSHSASWRAANNGPEEALITQLDAHVTTAENAAVAAVATTTGIKTPREAHYIQSPSPRSWGYVVEENLDPLATGAGWSVQHRLLGARPDYYRLSNGVEMYVDLTSVGQAGIGGNHITEKLDTAGFVSPDAAVAAADVTHRSTNPRGKAIAAVVLGNATMAQVSALQQYRRLTKSYLLKQTDVDFSPGMAKLFQKYGDVKHDMFTTKWKKSKRNKFAAEVAKALGKPKKTVSFKRHNTRSRSKAKK